MGLSYVEVLVTILLLSLVVGGLLPLLTSGDEAYQELRRRQEMVQNGRVALDKLLREMRATQAFQIVSPGAIRFTYFYGDGTGAFPTVEYVLNGATSTLEYRWQADWAFRRQITVSAPQAVPAGYSVPVTFNHAALVTAGRSLASGDDVRILYWTGTQWVELDRARDVPSTWNSAVTRVWFRLQAPIAAGGSNNNYYLHYGNLALGAPPANGDNVFLDYEDGSTLGGWIRRDACAGTHAPSADGVVFTTATGSCHRQLSKNVPHANVEIFWGFRSDPSSNADGHQAGVSARRSGTGTGYVLTLADEVNTTLRIRFWTVWSTTGGAIATTPASIVPGADYFGRFYLVGTTLQAKYWPVGAAEPGWMLTTTHSGAASGGHYGQVDGFDPPQNHRHRTIILRRRVANEPTTALGVEEDGTRPDPLESLAGPFRSLTVLCYDGVGGVIGCVPTTPVRSVQVALVVMDPTGRIPDITLTGRAFRQAP